MLEEQIKTYVTSLIRTVVPIVVGNLIGWFASRGIPLPEEAQASLSGLLILLIGALFSIAYYAVMRWLEMRWPAFGVFLGSKKQPLAYSREPEIEKAVIERALDATRDRAPDEEGEAADPMGFDAPEPEPAPGRHRDESRPVDGEW